MKEPAAIDVSGQIPAFFTIVPQRFHILTLSEYHNFSPVSQQRIAAGIQPYINDYPAGNFSFPGLDAFPNLIVGFGEGNGVQLGPDPNAPQFGAQDFYQVVDNIGWIKGDHNFKFERRLPLLHFATGLHATRSWRLRLPSFDGYFTDQVPDYPRNARSAI